MPSLCAAKAAPELLTLHALSPLDPLCGRALPPPSPRRPPEPPRAPLPLLVPPLRRGSEKELSVSGGLSGGKGASAPGLGASRFAPAPRAGPPGRPPAFGFPGAARPHTADGARPLDAHLQPDHPPSPTRGSTLDAHLLPMITHRRPHTTTANEVHHCEDVAASLPCSGPTVGAEDAASRTGRSAVAQPPLPPGLSIPLHPSKPSHLRQ